MNKSVSILIPNRNGFEATQLCVESIRKFTNYPNYKIIVYDDCSSYPQDGVKKPNMIDLTYLRECQEKGWLRLIEGKEHARHGGALNRLVNQECDTDYAMICDCDIQILQPNWLTDLITLAEKDPMVICIVNDKKPGYVPFGYRTGMFTFWFGLVNMKAYNDGMRVDWNVKRGDRREEPYKTDVAGIYPAVDNAIYKNYMRTGWNADNFDDNYVANDPGSMLYLKVKYDNPKGYKQIHIPMYIDVKYRHYSHISLLPYPSPLLKDNAFQTRDRVFRVIRNELGKIRCQT